MERRANDRQQDRAIFALELFDSFGEPRAFERRGGIAGRGRGSFLALPEEHSRESSEEANDSGYFSTVIHEEGDVSDADDGLFSPPLSPKTRVPPRVRTKQRTQRKRRGSTERPSLKRKPSWRPNLKHDSISEHTLQSHIRSDSIDSLVATDVWHKSDSQLYSMAQIDCTATASEPALDSQRPEPRRQSTLLHPSSPTIEAVSFQIIHSFPQAKVVHIHRPSSTRSATPDATPPPIRDKTTASPNHRPTMPPRKGSSLLHPSCPTSETSLGSQFKTIISIPPKKPSTPETSPPHSPAERSIPTTASLAQHIPIRTSSRDKQRQTSIIHSCLSDSEDEAPQALSGKNTGEGDDGGASSFRGHLAEAAEDAILARIDRKARAGRRMRTV
jgi:hypothetical protein